MKNSNFKSLKQKLEQKYQVEVQQVSYFIKIIKNQRYVELGKLYNLPITCENISNFIYGKKIFNTDYGKITIVPYIINYDLEERILIIFNDDKIKVKSTDILFSLAMAVYQNNNDAIYPLIDELMWSKNE